MFYTPITIDWQLLTNNIVSIGTRKRRLSEPSSSIMTTSIKTKRLSNGSEPLSLAINKELSLQTEYVNISLLMMLLTI